MPFRELFFSANIEWASTAHSNAIRSSGGKIRSNSMLVRLSTATAVICILSGAALAQGAAKPTDPQIAHIAYTAGQLDIEAAKQALAKSTNTDV
jgi:hypothetical protein